jgi:hypothetical protein
MKIKEIAGDFNLKVINITEANIDEYSKKFDIDKETLKNNAYIIGDQDIILGIYDNKEVRLAAFFHEIGHTLVSEGYEKLVNYDQVLVEYQAWIEGLKIAKKYGYTFSSKTFHYILKSLNSFYRDALNAYNTQNKKTNSEN